MILACHLQRWGLHPASSPRGCRTEPTRMCPVVGAGRYSDSRACPANRKILLPAASQPVEGPVHLTGVVLDYRCGAAPDSHRIPYWPELREAQAPAADYIHATPQTRQPTLSELRAGLYRQPPRFKSWAGSMIVAPARYERSLRDDSQKLLWERSTRCRVNQTLTGPNVGDRVKISPELGSALDRPALSLRNDDRGLSCRACQGPGGTSLHTPTEIPDATTHKHLVEKLGERALASLRSLDIEITCDPFQCCGPSGSGFKNIKSPSVRGEFTLRRISNSLTSRRSNFPK